MDKTMKKIISQFILLYFIWFQGNIKEGIEAAERAILMVNKLHLFSNNEELEEVATNEIKYVLFLLTLIAQIFIVACLFTQTHAHD